MDIQFLLFSFDGRIRRLHYWLASIGVGAVASVISSMLFGMSGVFMGHFNPLPMVLILPLVAAEFWIGIALGIKRCHDRDKSGLFLLVGLIPIIGGLWLLIDLGFIDGTPGPNQYGPSPKGLGATGAVA
jgi:uncharacterized membrane protein YhaH (DUF805 family)